ncbi:mCG144847, partial [Mus musculus]
LSGGPCGGQHWACSGGSGPGGSPRLHLAVPPPASQPSSTWRRPAGGGEGAGRRCAFPSRGPTFTPTFPPGGAVPGSGVEETPTRAQSRVPGRRSARVPTVWPARAPRPQWARGAPILSRVTLDPVIHEALKRETDKQESACQKRKDPECDLCGSGVHCITTIMFLGHI